MRVPRKAQLAEVKSASFLPPLRELCCAQPSQRDAGASGEEESRVRGAGERQGRASSAARGLH
eukprot:4713077-Pleurochrysis_carterae.AAC.1